jgi:hypothetical protein
VGSGGGSGSCGGTAAVGTKALTAQKDRMGFRGGMQLTTVLFHCGIDSHLPLRARTGISALHADDLVSHSLPPGINHPPRTLCERGGARVSLKRGDGRRGGGGGPMESDIAPAPGRTVASVRALWEKNVAAAHAAADFLSQRRRVRDQAGPMKACGLR